MRLSFNTIMPNNSPSRKNEIFRQFAARVSNSCANRPWRIQRIMYNESVRMCFPGCRNWHSRAEKGYSPQYRCWCCWYYHWSIYPLQTVSHLRMGREVLYACEYVHIYACDIAVASACTYHTCLNVFDNARTMREQQIITAIRPHERPWTPLCRLACRRIAMFTVTLRNVKGLREESVGVKRGVIEWSHRVNAMTRSIQW